MEDEDIHKPLYYPLYLQDFKTPSVVEYEKQLARRAAYQSYNPICRCGHLHSQHNEQHKTVNVSAGQCEKCDCEYFVIANNEPPKQ